MQFKGVENPDLYIIDFHQEDQPNIEYPLSGPRGDFLVSLLGSYGLLGSVRFANMAEQGEDCVEDDIIRVQPKLIATLGSQAQYKFIQTNRSITDISGNLYDIKIKGQDFKLLVLLSPTYVLKRMEDNSISLRFSQDLYKAFQFLNGQYVDVLKEKEILSAHSFKEFFDIYESHFKDDPEIAYDIETNARPPMMVGSEIIGFSIANKTSGVYISIDSLEFRLPKEDEDKIWKFIINEVFEKKSKLIIHNTMYERPYTLFCKGYEIKYEKAHDTLVMARLLRNPKEAANLKYQAQKYLHYPDWETDLITYVSCIKALISRVGFGPQKYQEIFNELCNNKYNSIFDITSTNYYSDDKDKCSSFWKLEKKDQDEFTLIFEKLNSVLVDLYSEEEIYYIGQLIMDRVVDTIQHGGIKDSTIPYNWIPDRLLSKYGAVDSLATFDLKEYFFDIMTKESTEKINLFKGYENWLEHMYVAYIMERNGMYWNDDLAMRDRAQLTAQATICLRELLKSPHFERFIEQHCEEKYRPLILADYLPIIAQSQGYEINYDHVTDKYTVKYNGKRIKKDAINSIIIPDQYKKQYSTILKQLFYDDVNKAPSYEELKEIYNPASPTDSSDIAKAIFLTSDLQMGGRINELHTLSTSPSFGQVKDRLPAIDQKFLEIADYCCDVDKLKENYPDNWAGARKSFYEGFCRLYQNYRKQVTAPEIKAILDNKNPVQIETFDDNGVITIFDNMVVQGIDPDDQTTWTSLFQWLVNFRIFKKVIKIVSTYIDGSTGHDSVAIVNKDQLRNGVVNLARKRYYNEGIAGSNEDYLLMSSWSPNTAETGRWRSSFHTLPWTSPVKKYYESRFIGGCTVCPDYSAMEVRSLAAISKDANMLKLFNDGEDFHTNTATVIFRKPKEEITPTERRFSKTGTFSILYGSSEKSFADKYCNGDISYAHQIYEGFYNAYPGAKKWMDERHEEVLREHRVSLELSQRFIPIVPDGDDPGSIGYALRRSVNYPIQGQSADITGCVIFDLQKYIEEHNMKSLIFMYVHDSIEVDIYPYEFFEFIEYLKYLLNEAPMRRMNLPSKADVALGKSLGDEIDLEGLEVAPDKKSGTLVLKGYKDEIEETVENWRKAYKTVEVSEENYKDVYISMNELFMLKKAYSPTVGTYRQKGTCKVYINYYN